ncbi:hypothetical protein ACFSUD_02425 [Sulfitobacter aestuarii]|uniref:Uncharacterized protein n=1 Tax=Sulfitobacter aestuarii TaxID=2161676 RepID=A0ABW5TZT3_9RHOB
MRYLILAAICALIPMAVNAQAYRAVNGLIVVPLSNGDFEVIEARGEGARGLWCAAADYALGWAGGQRAERLYVKRARASALTAPGHKGVVFTLDGERLGTRPSRSYSVSVRQVGESLPLHHAYQFCKDFIIEPDDF